MSQTCGTTGAMVYIEGHKLVVGNLGDTRVVLCRKGNPIRISFDHKPMDDEDRVVSLGGFVSTSDTTKRINGLIAGTNFP